MVTEEEIARADPSAAAYDLAVSLWGVDWTNNEWSNLLDFAAALLQPSIEAARAGERERCAKVADDEPELPGEPSAQCLEAMIAIGPIENARAAVKLTKRCIAAAIRSNGGRG